MRIGNNCGRELLVLGLQVREFERIVWDLSYFMPMMRISIGIARKTVVLALVSWFGTFVLRSSSILVLA